MELEIQRTRKLVANRLTIIRDVALQLPSNCPLPWLAFLRELLVNILPSLHTPLRKQPVVRKSQSGRMQIIRGGLSEFRISNEFCQMLRGLANGLNPEGHRFNDAIDNFLIHELVHWGQGFAEEGHSGLSSRARRIVDSIDYQADAWAVLIHFSLANLAPSKFGAENENPWRLYARLIHAVLYQMHLFRLIDESKGPPIELRSALETREARMDIYSLGRVASWHYQFHRAEMFNQEFEIGDFQLLVRPELSFRNTPSAGNKLNANWPNYELRSKLNVNNIQPLAFTGVTRYGLNKVERFTPSSPEHYPLAFEGFFSCNVDQSSGSAPFFRRLFEVYPEFTLRNASPPTSTPPRYGSGSAIVQMSLEKALARLAAMFEPSSPFAPARAHLAVKTQSDLTAEG